MKYELSESTNSKDFGDQYHLSEMAIKRQNPVFTAFRNPDLMTRFEIEIQLMSPLDEWWWVVFADEWWSISKNFRLRRWCLQYELSEVRIKWEN